MSKMRYIPGFNKRYSATEDGKIYSHISELYLRKQVSVYGREVVMVRPVRGGKPILRQVSRLVALALIPNIDDKPHVNHRDGVKLNNHIDNLEWCTPKENHAHAFKLGLRKPLTSMQAHARKLEPQDVEKIRKLYREGHKQLELAISYGVDQSNISRIVNNKYWRNL